jgi:hypothetical protein
MYLLKNPSTLSVVASCAYGVRYGCDLLQSLLFPTDLLKIMMKLSNQGSMGFVLEFTLSVNRAEVSHTK